MRAIAWAALALLELAAPLLAAQGAPAPRGGLRTATHVGIGYVASIPTTFLGASAIVVTPGLFGGAGLYADGKFTSSSPGDSPYYLPGVTVAEAEGTYGDQFYVHESDWAAFNVAAVYAVTNEFAVYGGLGYAKETRYREYYDETQTRGQFGFYWIEDPSNSGTRVNVLGGAFVHLTRFMLFQIGGEAAPRGANVGLTLLFGR